ncbi:hypothetical protein E2562_007688 [Oryza meyeriana var. granulata]|uniref:Uncharacterized protein n=1 Tax=Oryza meyeriana var. granulata TaxID=110450 RepID=A0A6G1EFG5_9ORYZ|nr:hypothetical protein E2562_007688 [Oryza meyeriana var. granulata]
MAQESLRLVSHPIAAHDGRLPRHYTLEGQGAKKDISPPLEWYGVPDGTRSLALVVQDIDAPDPEGPIGLPEGFSGKESTAGRKFGGIQESVNDWKQPGWRGHIPTSRGHHIQLKLYALDDEVHLGNKARHHRVATFELGLVTKDKLMEAIEGHVLGEAELTAVF